ncbi:MAG: 3-oxoacyl-ACP synthase [Bacilli bacterium]|nr:3-oxoacyl-ACP synthase [Bacilli bacterium]
MLQGIPVGIIGTGSAVPELILTNADLEKMVDTSDEWIKTRTGIQQRRIAGEGQSTSDYAYMAAVKALADAGITADELDLIIVATVTPDYQFPATACLLQNRLGATRAAAFDLSAGCSGFLYAVSTAAPMIASGLYRKILVIGADLLSRITNYQDRNTCVLFGDAAGAVVLGEVPQGKGILSIQLGSDGSGGELLIQRAGGSKAPASTQTVAEHEHSIVMNGKEVFKFAVRIMDNLTREAVEKAGLSMADVDCLIPHQANIRIIDAARERLGLTEEQVFVNVQNYGNTSSASIPLALDEAKRSGRLGSGDLLVLCGFGAGLTWGACAIRM